METDFMDRPPRSEDKARICLIDLENNNKLEVLTETSAWNFHQGARLQWLSGYVDKIIYNDRMGDRFVSVIFDVKKQKEEKILDYPIYAVHPSGKFGLGLNFSRLQKHGGYGYRGGSQEGLENLFPKDDGIWKVNLETGEKRLIISTYDIAYLNNVPYGNEHHILTHIVFNPSGSRICFIDKYRLPDGGFMQRLITANPNGSDLYVLPGHISHFGWENDNEIFGYGKFSPKIMALRKTGFLRNPLLKPFLNIARKMRGGLKQKIAGQSYLLFKDETQNVERVAVGVMTEDGHPQFSPNRQWVITDTYPDKNHYRTLILYNWNNGKKIDLGRFHSFYSGADESWDISEMRSDLHPRWNRQGTKVCFDSVHEGTKQMYVVDLSELV